MDKGRFNKKRKDEQKSAERRGKIGEAKGRKEEKMRYHSEQELVEMRERVEDLNDEKELSFTQKLTLNYLRIRLGIRNVREIMGDYN